GVAADQVVQREHRRERQPVDDEPQREAPQARRARERERREAAEDEREEHLPRGGQAADRDDDVRRERYVRAEEGEADRVPADHASGPSRPASTGATQLAWPVVAVIRDGRPSALSARGLRSRSRSTS